MAHAVMLATLASVLLDVGPTRDLKRVADRLHGRVALVRARALLLASVDDRAEIREAVSLGSGVVVAGGLVLTALHTVVVPDEAGRLRPVEDIEVVAGDTGVVRATVIAGNAQLDVAVLSISAREPLAAIPFAAAVPAAGESVVVLGFNGRGVLALRAEADGDGGARLHSSASLEAAMWGGPVLNAQGELVGLTSSVGSVVPAQRLQELMDPLQ